MTERETIYTGLSHAAWGYFFLHFNLSFNGVNVLPNFVGWCLLLSAISKLSGERRDLKLLRPLAALLACWNGVDWLLSWGGGSVEEYDVFVGLLVTASSLYFHFQFLTDMAALAAQYQPEGGDLDRCLLRRRTAYTVMLTAVCLIANLNELAPWEGWAWATTLLALVGLIVALMIMLNLFDLRKCFQEEERDSGLE